MLACTQTAFRVGLRFFLDVPSKTYKYGYYICIGATVMQTVLTLIHDASIIADSHATHMQYPSIIDNAISTAFSLNISYKELLAFEL